MRGVITAPKKIITGAFTVLFAFIRELELTADDVVVETLEGDALGHHKDTFGGGGRNYHLLCYLPDERTGKSRISVNKEGVAVEPVIVAYDTVRSVLPVWGLPFVRNGKIEIPLTFPCPVINLRKRNFQVSETMQRYVYGAGADYHFVVSPSDIAEGFSVTVSGPVQKENGLDAVIQETVVEVDRGTSG